MRLLAITFGSGGAGALLMLVFDTTLTRIAGLLLLAVFIVCGTFLVASPEFLEGDREDEED